MYNLSWLTDIHLDHLSLPKVLEFCKSINESNSDGFLITGDISNARFLTSHLTVVANEIKKPIYYVLGNHDLWGSSRDYVYSELSRLNISNLIFLDINKEIKLTLDTYLIGHSGWYDLINGDYKHSGFFPNGMPEFRFVSDFLGLSPNDKKQKCEAWTKEAADHLEINLVMALEKEDCKTVYCGTHVPPYREASWYMGKMSNDEGAPFFSNKIIGDRLSEVMKSYPDKELIVLAGHTHDVCLYKPAQNITVHVAPAEYGNPAIYKTFSI